MCVQSYKLLRDTHPRELLKIFVILGFENI